MSKTLDAQFAGYAAAVARALQPVATAKDIDWINLYVVEVRFGAEGEDLDFSLIPDETGEGFDIAFKGDA